jgi:bifunctional non-homologous end joining protein LigD
VIPLKPMLCKEGKGRAFPSGAAWSIEPKLDGWRFLFHVTDAGVRSYAGRNGSDRTGQPAKIEEALRFLPHDTVLDAELVVLGERSPKVSSVLANPHAGALHAVVFDILRIAGHDVTGAPLYERRALLDKAAAGFDGLTLNVIDSFAATDDPEGQHEEWLARGYEGTVAKLIDSRYHPGRRSSEWVKFKPQTTADVRIVGFEEGEGSWAGTYGAFEIELLDNGVETTCAIPTKDMRRAVTEDRSAWEGRIIEIAHHGLMESGKPRHPVYKRMRPDLEPAGKE